MSHDLLIQLLERLIEDTSLLLDSEEATKQGIILPILGRLEWDRDNIREVMPEYRVEKGRVDYCLRVGHRSAVFLEAKRTDKDLDRHQEQLLDYAFREGVELAVLTNGIVWWLYLPLLKGSWEQRKFLTIDISQQEPPLAAEQFAGFLARSAVESGEAVQKAEALHKSREKNRLTKTTLPKAWRQLCEEPDELLADLLAEKVESLCGHQPTPDQVAGFLEAAVPTLSPPGEKKPRPRRGKGPIRDTKPGGQVRPRGEYAHKRPRAVTVLGAQFPATTWKEVLVGVCREVAVRHPEEFERVLEFRGRKRVYFSRDFRGMRSPLEIPGTRVFVETHLSASSIVKRCHQVLKLFGHGQESLNVQAD